MNGGGGGYKPTVNNNSVVVEKSSEAFYRHAGGKPDSMDRVFALDYAKLRQNYTYRLWLVGIYFVFFSAIITVMYSTFANNDEDVSAVWTFNIVLSVLSFGGAWALMHRILYRARRTIHQQHVTLTATGIRYDKHNFPDGSTFHTTIHVRVVSSFNYLFACFVLFCFCFCLFLL
jgi:hypothetical protein